MRAPFLTESDVIDLTQADQVLANNEQRDTGFSKKTQAVIAHDFFAVIIPSYAMLYAYSREYLAWKTIDLQEDVDGTEDGNTCVAAKVILLDSQCFVLLSDERAESMDVRVWDLGSIFKNTHQNPPLNHCSIPLKQCKSITTLDVQRIKENDTAFVVSCHAKKGEKEGLQIWEMNWSDDKRCAIQSDHFVASSSTFPLECLKPASFFWLSMMNHVWPEHNDLADLFGAGCDRRGDDLVMHFQLGGSAWLCIPRVNLWRPP